eukprot:4637644-Prymnesium_polylepis.1
MSRRDENKPRPPLADRLSTSDDVVHVQACRLARQEPHRTSVAVENCEQLASGQAIERVAPKGTILLQSRLGVLPHEHPSHLVLDRVGSLAQRCHRAFGGVHAAAASQQVCGGSG